MGNPSIFTKIVRNEDDHTQLLSNLMNRCQTFQAVMLKSFTNGAFKVSNAGSKMQITTQHDLAGDGRADLVVKADDLMMILEVKLRDSCGMTENQIKRKYVDYLLGESGHSAKWLVYLVPSAWIHKQEAEDMLAAEKERVNTRLVTWEQVCLEIQSPSCQSCDPLVHEFGHLLKPRFGPITFTAEEIKRMFDQSFPKNFSEVRKLEKLLDDLANKIRKECKEKNKDMPPNVDRFHVEDERTAKSYGAYLKKGNEHYLLWIAICDDVPAPISFGIEEAWEKDTPGLIVAFKSSKGIHPEHSQGDYLHHKISKDVFKKEALPVEEIWKTLQPVLEGVFKAAER